MTAVLDQVREAEPDYSDVTGLVGLGACRALEHEFEVFVPPVADFVEALGRLVAPFRTRRPRPGQRRYTIHFHELAGRYVLYCDGARVASGVGGADLVRHLAWHVNRSVIDGSVARYHLMHASAVTRAGQTVVLPADMESGKTTTCAGLLRQGYRYVTDEAVAIDPDTGAVTPFPKRLSIDAGSWHLFPDLQTLHGEPYSEQWQVAPEELGAATATRAVPAPAVVVFPKYTRGASTHVEPMSAAEATCELARMTFHFARDPRRNLAVAARLARHATVARLRIGDLDEAVEAIEGLVSERLLEAL